MAEQGVLIAMAYMLQVFRIGKEKNEDGSEKPFEPQWENTLLSWVYLIFPPDVVTDSGEIDICSRFRVPSLLGMKERRSFLDQGTVRCWSWVEA